MPEQTHYVAEVIDDCRRRALDLEWDMKNKWPEWSQDEAVLGIICVAQNLQASLGSLGATMKAQPPAASGMDGFVFERVNMGRGNERYVGLADGSEGTTVQEDGDGPGDTRSRLLWRIADAALAASVMRGGSST